MLEFRKLAVAASAMLTLAAGTGVANAQSISLFDPATSGISSLDFDIDGAARIVTLRETWGSTAPGFVNFIGFTGTWTVRKLITNNSGVDWDSFANELLDPLFGGPNDVNDVLPYPAFVPPGYSTSNDGDLLSFNQGGAIPRTSSVFASVLADELTDVRDFLDFFNGILADGGADNFMSFGLTNDSSDSTFLLAQRPNEFSTVIPVPAALPLLVSGLLAMAFVSRRRRE